MAISDVLSHAIAEFEKAIFHLKDEYARLQLGRASSALVENIPVDVYGSSQPIKAIAGISIPNPRMLQIQPWDKNTLAAIEKAIVGVGTGLNPINDGICVRINIPPLTEERRLELTKHVKRLAEDGRIAVRNARHDALNLLKKMKTDEEISEDEFFGAEKQLQAKVDDVNKKLEEIATVKEKDVMTV